MSDFGANVFALNGITELRMECGVSIFCMSVTKMSEKAQRMDLLSLSEAKEKTNINHSSPLGPSAQSLGEWHKDSKNVVFKSVEGKRHSIAPTHNNMIKRAQHNRLFSKPVIVSIISCTDKLVQHCGPEQCYLLSSALCAR